MFLKKGLGAVGSSILSFNQLFLCYQQCSSDNETEAKAQQIWMLKGFEYSSYVPIRRPYIHTFISKMLPRECNYTSQKAQLCQYNCIYTKCFCWHSNVSTKHTHNQHNYARKTLLRQTEPQFGRVGKNMILTAHHRLIYKSSALTSTLKTVAHLEIKFR